MKNTSLDLLNQRKLNKTQAAQALGMSRTHFDRLAKQGKTPSPISIAGKDRWLEKDLEQWILDQNPQLRDQQLLMQQAMQAVKGKNKPSLKAVS